MTVGCLIAKVYFVLEIDLQDNGFIAVNILSEAV